MITRDKTKLACEFRYRQGVSECGTCEDCGVMFHRKHHAKRCDECREIQRQLLSTTYYLKKTLFGIAYQSTDQLKSLKRQMMEEEGSEFTDEIFRPVCNSLKGRRVNEDEY
jgi:hypothetical protein